LNLAETKQQKGKALGATTQLLLQSWQGGTNQH
jgi:hypothetical protein